MLAGVAALALACYANSLGGALLFDDVNAIVDNRLVRAFDVRGIVRTPSWWGEPGRASWAPAYRPLTTLTFALNHALGGLDPLGYHAVNVLLHAAVCALLAVVLGEVTRRPRLAALAALLFAAHPVHTEAVASVVGRAETLAALLGLGAWWMVLRARRRERGRAAWLAGAALALAAGVLAKENAATIPAVVIAADLIAGSGVTRARAAEYAALAAGTVAAIALRSAVMGGLGPTPGVLDNVLAGAPPVPRLLTALALVALYARRLVWPFRLSADYSYRQVELATGAGDPRALAGVAVVAIAVALGVWGWRRARPVCLGVALAALPYAIVANVFVTIGTLMAERLLYLPSVGFCLLAALALEALGRRLGGAMATGALAVALLGCWVPATVLRNGVWRERRTFFETMVESAPRSARSHRELALVYSDLGLHERAIAELRLALAILPDEAIDLYDLGNVLLRAGRPAEAIDAYRRSLAHDAGLVPAMTNLGNAYSAAGDEPSAEVWFRAGLARAPRAFDLHLNLANSLIRQGRLAEAEAEYRVALVLAPEDPLVHANYGVLLRQRGALEEAGAELRQAAALPPPTPAAAAAVVTILRAVGMLDAARAAQARAERLFPDDPAVRRLGGG